MTTYPQLAPGENPTTSMSKEAIAWRYEFSKASNAIEDAPTDPGLDAIYKQLIAEGITDFDEQTKRTQAYLDDRLLGARALQVEIADAGLPREIGDQVLRAYFRAGPPARTLCDLFGGQPA